MLKSLGNLIWGQQDPTVVRLTSGQLFSRAGKDGGLALQLVFKDAQASIRSTSAPHQYQLVISRVYEEGEEELLQEQGIDLDDDYEFLLDTALHMHVTQVDGTSAFVWDDLTGEPGDKLQFIVDEGIPQAKVTEFERAALRCMFERQYERPGSEATDEDLEALKYSKPAADSSQAASASSAAQTLQLPAVRDAPTDNAEETCNSTAQLFLFNPETGTFQLQAREVHARLMLTAPYEYWLYVENDTRCWLRQAVEPGMNAVFNREHASFIWCQYEDSGEVFSWSLRFPNPEDETTFRETFSRCAYETMNRAKFAKVSKVDQEYLLEAYQEDVEMTDAEPLSENDDERSDEESAAEEDTEEEEEAVDSEEEEERSNALGKQAKNSQLAVGYKHDRSFVVRGNKIGVFKHTDNKLQFSAAINDIKTLDGKVLNPQKVMLHEEDSAMVMMDPMQENMLYKMDLEYGKVVEEWQVHESVPCTAFAPDTKYAQLTQQKTLVGLSHNSLYRIDPRLSGQKLVEDEFRTYSGKYGFSCVATTEQGWAAVGNEKGEIRLFNKLGIIAKAALPAIGDAILGLDVTADGRWLVATCRTYLLLVDCWNKQENISGFVKGFPKDKKPVPKRLQLKPEHVAYMGSQVSFTVARFNTGINEHEKTIVTSTGPYVITWNFRRVKQGKLYDYQIKQYDENVVADNFKYGQDRNIIVALPDDVQMAAKRNLNSPKKVLQTPSKSLRSRSNIVNTPY
ncbi:VID27 cytoplasmic protein-domain-containing protein [Thamnocephalis sphaerospora]|uniref:VID27 cytoplasmic protein-domain-containing protein n=1 Tax=Thamnocephalis sphaerospora TaxID=78915 RepID=A0A4P9XWU0_9FUNG|nr:VID27 cytoplasmic protein-domain-containing protein [Thamnocephalis sphaerospora]|eukprot:RKP10131.1 VID27 cytoplasmic protein-domain-containing protein [Thamnocephalis sphaerospora]